MFKLVLFFSLVMSAQAFAQDMSRTETFENSYTEDAHGDTYYSGKCSTHEVYENKYFKETSTIQPYTSVRDLSSRQLAVLIKKVGRPLLTQLMADNNIEDFVGPNKTLEAQLSYILDDITVTTITSKLKPNLNLIRVSHGQGGGNGGYIVYNKTKQGGRDIFTMLSSTFDSDLQYCDKLMWLK